MKMMTFSPHSCLDSATQLSRASSILSSTSLRENPSELLMNRIGGNELRLFVEYVSLLEQHAARLFAAAAPGLVEENAWQSGNKHRFIVMVGS